MSRLILDGVEGGEVGWGVKEAWESWREGARYEVHTFFGEELTNVFAHVCFEGGIGGTSEADRTVFSKLRVPGEGEGRVGSKMF